MPHDIIDNRNEKLVDHLNCILGTAEAAKMAVGYFFLSGFGAVREKLATLKSIRILIGNTANRETIEQLSEACKRLELVRAAEEKERFQTKSVRRQRAEETARNLRQTIERMDQTDAEQGLVLDLIRLIEEKRLQVKVYTKGRLHAKAYIFDYPSQGHYEHGIAIVGSSNLSLSGVTHNTELNVVVQGNNNHAELVRWFDELWQESQDFDETLMNEMKQSWAVASVRLPSLARNPSS